jgi:hypothetical protein
MHVNRGISTSGFETTDEYPPLGPNNLIRTLSSIPSTHRPQSGPQAAVKELPHVVVLDSQLDVSMRSAYVGFGSLDGGEAETAG